MSRNAKLVNIFCGNNDPFFRYKRHEIESRNKFSITYITNLKQIAKDLNVSHLYLIKHFGQDFNTMSKFNSDTNELQINGIHSSDLLEKSLNRFIDQYIICFNCHLPEVDYLPKKNYLGASCSSCGHRHRHSLTNKLTKFIHQHELANKNNSTSTKKKNKESKNDKNDVLNKKDENKVKRNVEQEEQLSIDELLGESSDFEWNLDVSNEKVSARRKEVVGENKFLDDLLQ